MLALKIILEITNIAFLSSAEQIGLRTSVFAHRTLQKLKNSPDPRSSEQCSNNHQRSSKTNPQATE